MDDRAGTLSSLKTTIDNTEKAMLSSTKVGDIIYVSLDREDGLILKDNYQERRKYIVIIGFTPEGNAVGSLLINSQINHFKRSPELLKHQYCLLHSKYSHILNYDSWLDCSDIFEIPKAKINNKNGKVKGSLDSEDKENVIKLLTESDLFNNALKRRYGILK